MRSTRVIRNLTLLKAVGAILGLVYSILQVQLFGATRSIEVFLAAQAIILVFISISQSGQIAEVFLPEYLKIKEEHGITTAFRSFSVIINWVILISVPILSVLYLVSPLAISIFIPGFGSDLQYESILYFRAMLLMIIFQVISSFINTLLNAERIFGRVELAAICRYVFSISFLYIFHDDLGIWALIWSLYIGHLIDLLISYYFLRRISFRYFLGLRDVHIRDLKLHNVVSSTLFYTSSSQVLNWAYTASLSYLPEGYYAVYRYVSLLFSKISSLVVDPAKTVLFTDFSILVNRDVNELKRLLSKSLRFSTYIGSFVFILTLFSGYQGLHLMWAGKSFDSDLIGRSFIVLICMFSFFPVQISYGIFRKLTITLGLTRLVYTGQAFTQLVSAAIVYLLIYHFHFLGLILGIIVNRALLITVPFMLCIKLRNSFVEFPSRIFFWSMLTLIVCLTGIFYILWVEGFVNQYGANSLKLIFNIVGMNILAISLFLAGSYALQLRDFRDIYKLAIQRD